ncbi:MAG: helix-turn-helix domain-containing protein [Proteobacteria bacterium]|nr:helix-turn-helix domain-containing protein [Pseudomonadota bacterium]
MFETPFSSEGLLPIQSIRNLTRVSDVTIYRWVKAGKFPAPVKHMGKTRYWRASHVNTWFEQAGTQS